MAESALLHRRRRAITVRSRGDAQRALCVARSNDGDYLMTEVCYPRRHGEIYLARYARCHRCWDTPGIASHKALVFKQYNSRINGVARFAPHAAFAHPQLPAGARPRISVEARCLVVYD